MRMSWKVASYSLVIEEGGKGNMSGKQNCWEFNKCGREPSGANIAELGECITPRNISSDGLNGGKNGGRICWAVAGTFCRNNVQCIVTQNLMSCAVCDFFIKVMNEEDQQFTLITPSS